MRVFTIAAQFSMTRRFAKTGSNGQLLFLNLLLLIFGIAVIASSPAWAAQNEAQPGSSGGAETNASELLRSNLQLQEQLHRVQLSIEENRQLAEAAAMNNAQSISTRLQFLEQTLAAERARDIDAVRSSTRVMWLVAGTFGVVGILAMLL